MVKVTEFMIGIIFVGFIITAFGLFMSDLNESYDLTYNESDLAVYNQLEEMKDIVEEIEEQSDIKEKNIKDIIGGYFTDAYNILRLTKSSYNLFDTMSNTAVEHANLGEAGQYLRVAISTAVLVLIIVGVMIAAIVKWYL